MTIPEQTNLSLHATNKIQEELAITKQELATTAQELANIRQKYTAVLDVCKSFGMFFEL